MAKYAPHTATSALARVRAKVKAGATNQVGMCAHEIIVNILGIPGPWKWGGNGRAYAVNYFLGAQKVVRTNDPTKIPAGAVVIWGPRPGATTVGGKAGHIAMGDGNGYCDTTDLPRTGHWGRVKISDVTRLWGKPLLGYVLVDGMGYDLRDKPTNDTATVTSVFWNVSGYDDARGAKNGVKRIRAGIAAWLKRAKPDVIGFAELSGVNDSTGTNMVDEMDRQLRGLFTRAPGGGKGTHLYLRAGAKRIASGQVELTPKYQGNDKQCSWVVYELDGARCLDGAGHLTPQKGADDYRPKQAKSARDQLSAIAKHYDVPAENIQISLDGNSDSWVADDAEKDGWQSAVRVAAKKVNAGYRSLNQWLRTKKGPQIDVSLTRKGVPILEQRISRLHKLADHNPLRVIRRVTKK